MSHNAKSELTKNALADSLKKLMISKPINKISIREITESCGFQRLTFYYHFDDVYDLLQWTMRRELIIPIKESGAFSTWQESGIYLLRYLKNNKALSLSILNSIGRETLKNLISNDTYELCMYFLRNIGGDLDISDEDYHTLCNFYCVSLAALATNWLESNTSETPEEAIAKLETIIEGTARHALERFAKKDSPSHS